MAISKFKCANAIGLHNARWRFSKKCEYRAAHPERHVGALCADPWRLARGACCSLSGRAYHRRCNSDAEAVAADADAAAAAAAAAAASASLLPPLPQSMLMMLPPIPLQRAQPILAA